MKEVYMNNEGCVSEGSLSGWCEEQRDQEQNIWKGSKVSTWVVVGSQHFGILGIN